MYTFTMVGCTLFKLCHCKCTKAYSLEILGMSRLWHDLMAHGDKQTKNKTPHIQVLTRVVVLNGVQSEHWRRHGFHKRNPKRYNINMDVLRYVVKKGLLYPTSLKMY